MTILLLVAIRNNLTHVPICSKCFMCISSLTQSKMALKQYKLNCFETEYLQIISYSKLFLCRISLINVNTYLFSLNNMFFPLNVEHSKTFSSHSCIYAGTNQLDAGQQQLDNIYTSKTSLISAVKIFLFGISSASLFF